jgi:hypothetical protein
MSQLAERDKRQRQGWEAKGRLIAAQANQTMWDLGDWLNEAEEKWGEKYKRAAEITGLAVQTLKNAAYVAGRFESSRRRDELSVGHHQLVAAIPANSARMWLDLAVEHEWSVRELQAELRDVKQLPPGQPEVVVTIFKLTVPTEHEERWRAAAEHRGLDVEDWLVAVADEAASR